MKKIVVTLLALVMALSLPMTAFAASGAFLSSPSTNADVQMTEFSFTGNCGGKLFVTPYGDIAELDDVARNAMEDAYNSIAANKDLSKIVDALKAKAEAAGIDVTNLAVSDLFYLGYDGCADHNGHTYTVKLKPEVLNSFFSVMQYVDGKWVVVENAKVEGGYLTLSGNTYGPIAIVVQKDGTATGDAFPWIYVVLMAVSAAGLVAVSMMYKKKVA